MFSHTIIPSYLIHTVLGYSILSITCKLSWVQEACTTHCMWELECVGHSKDWSLCVEIVLFSES